MSISVGGNPIAQVFVGADSVKEVYHGADLVWQNMPKVTINQTSDVWTKIKESNNFPRNDGRYWTRADQLVTGVPNWNEYPLQEVPFRLVLAPTFTAGQGMFSSYLGGYPAKNKLVTAPKMDTSRLTDMTAFFWNAVNLENIPEYTVTASTSIKDFVANCPKIKGLVLRGCGRVQDTRNMFGGSGDPAPASCTRVELHGLGPFLPNGHVVDLSKTALTEDGAAALFDSLGTVTSGRTVTLKLPSSALGARQGVARSKGWTVTPESTGEVVITGTSGTQARGSFRAALSARGLDYKTVETVPFFLNTSNVTNMRSLFQGCTALTEVPDMDTSNVTDMSYMFDLCSSLTSVPEFDTGRVVNMSTMFNGCAALTSVPDMDTSNVTDMRRMFQGCTALTEVPTLDLSNVTSMDSMFRLDAAVTSVELSGLSRVSLAGSAFAGCTSLTSLTVDGLGPSFQQQSLPGAPYEGQPLDLRDTALTPAAADRLMSGLGGNEFSAKLLLPATASGCDTSVAVAKGWTV